MPTDASATSERGKAPKLTASTVDRYRGNGEDRWIKDGGAACLYLRVRPNGAKVFAVRIKRQGRLTVEQIGAWPAMTLKVARREAAIRSGRDSSDTMTAKTSEAMQDFWTSHIESEWKDTRNAAVYRRVIHQALGDKQMRAVRRADVSDMVRRYRVDKDENPRPVAANRLLAFTKLFFSWALEAGYLETSPAEAVTTRMAGGKETERERVLSDDEVRELWHFDDGPHTRLLRGLLLTGCRISELQKATTNYLRGDRLIIPAQNSKNGREHWVHVTPTLRDQFDGRAPMLFNHASPTAVQAHIRRWQSSADDAWTPHDLRRTFATIAARLGTPPHVVAALLNHTLVGGGPATKIYLRHDWADERVAVTKAVEGHLLKLASAP